MCHLRHSNSWILLFLKSFILLVNPRDFYRTCCQAQTGLWNVWPGYCVTTVGNIWQQFLLVPPRGIHHNGERKWAVHPSCGCLLWLHRKGEGKGETQLYISLKEIQPNLNHFLEVTCISCLNTWHTFQTTSISHNWKPGVMWWPYRESCWPPTLPEQV